MTELLRKKRAPSDDNGDLVMEDAPPTARSETNDAEQQKAADKSAENGENTMEEEKGAKAEEDGENEEEGEERWEVEKITNHTARKGAVKYWVKWIGYSEDENTWEPHINMMEDAPEAVGEYWKSIKNGKEIYAKLFGTSGKGAKNNDVASSNKRRKTSETAVWNTAASRKAVKEAPSNSSGMQKSNRTATENKLTNVDVGEGEDGEEDDQDLVTDGSWPIDGLDWETEVREVATMERNSKNELMVYLTWNNGKKTAHPASEVNPKCPQKIIKFYESHLRFKSVEPYSA